MAAVRSVIESLVPVTLVNLSDLSKWLFPKARFPAMALFARHREQPADRMTLVQARWSPAGERSHAIEIAPGDIRTLPIASWKRNPGLFKAAFVGHRHDLILLDDLWERFSVYKNTGTVKKNRNCVRRLAEGHFEWYRARSGTRIDTFSVYTNPPKKRALPEYVSYFMVQT